MQAHSDFPPHDPRRYAQKAAMTLDQLVTLLREDLDKVGASPKAQALYETAAEVLTGLRTAFEHYVSGEEAALREPTLPAQPSARPMQG